MAAIFGGAHSSQVRAHMAAIFLGALIAAIFSGCISAIGLIITPNTKGCKSPCFMGMAEPFPCHNANSNMPVSLAWNENTPVMMCTTHSQQNIA